MLTAIIGFLLFHKNQNEETDSTLQVADASLLANTENIREKDNPEVQEDESKEWKEIKGSEETPILAKRLANASLVDYPELKYPTIIEEKLEGRIHAYPANQAIVRWKGIHIRCYSWY